MKEISIEEKAKAYDNVREKIAIRFGSNVAKEIFSEYEESEDERVRKELLDFCKNRAEKYPNDPKYKNISAWIAWLEKQVSACLSHDDEIMIRQLIDYFTTGKGLQNTNDTIVEWIVDIKRKLEKLGEQKPYGQRQECLDCQFNYAGECKGSCAMKRGEQKPVWSEEDGKMINKLLAVVNLYYDRSGNDLDKQSCISFLKSLKDRVQPKQELSKEDEVTRNALINLVEMYYGGCIDKSEKNRLLSWLKSLRSQNTWKPSDEQMNALNTCLIKGEISYVGQGSILQSLYDKLKTL